MAATIHFLLVYSYSEQRLVDKMDFTDGKEAAKAYRDAEEKYLGKADEFEVVLVGADSIETIKRTHGHYFLEASTGAAFSDLITH